MLAALDIAGEMVLGAGGQARLWRETRAGIDSFDPDLNAARHQLARSTLLQLIVNPHVIHVVSYCEALHIAGVDEIVDSSKLVRRCVRIFREHALDLLRLRQHPLVSRRQSQLVSEASCILRHIAALDGQKQPSSNTPPSALIRRLAEPEVLLRSLETGVMAAPGIFYPRFEAARNVATAPLDHGFIECLHPVSGRLIPESERLRLLAKA
jgi:hypothetical protein